MTGRVHSIQSMGTLDGPGVRFVVFLQGCPLRCYCCHNPDTWELDSGKVYTASELVTRALRYREYFGNEGGVTVSGGEPLLQADFVAEFFQLCHEAGLNTCLDTSGCILTPKVKTLLTHTDRVLLDIKYTSEEDYRTYVGCGIETPLAFLEYLEAEGIPTTLRQVTIPSINDSAEQILALKEIAESHKNVDKVELLPFRKVCELKYQAMKKPFPFAHFAEPSAEKMEELNLILRGEK